MKILVVGPAWVGDMVMAESLFSVLKASGIREKKPVEIHVLAVPWVLPVVKSMASVSKVIACPIKHGEFGLLKRYTLGKSLRDAQYDWAIVLPNSWKSALIPFFAKIQKRTGYIGESRYGLLNDIYFLNKQQHPQLVQRFVALAGDKGKEISYAAPALVPPTEPGLLTALEDVYTDATTPQILALCPGAEFGIAKQWRPEYYAAVALYALTQGHIVLLLGSPNDQSAGEAIMTHLQAAFSASHQISESSHQSMRRCLNLIGKTSLTQAVAYLAKSDAVVTNDSGLMHVASAFKKRVLAIFGPTPTAYTPPLTPHGTIFQKKLACTPCQQRECPLGHHECMKAITPKLIIEALTACGF